MTTETTTADMTLTKKGDRYNIAINGTYVGWVCKNADRTWTVREMQSATEVGNDSSRTAALEEFAMWIGFNPFFISTCESAQADHDLMMNDFDAWLATR